MDRFKWCLSLLCVSLLSSAESQAQGGLIVPGDPHRIVVCSYSWGECEFHIPLDQWESTWQYYPCDALFALFECLEPSRKRIETSLPAVPLVDAFELLLTDEVSESRTSPF